MIYLIHIGVDGGAPRSRPYFELSAREFFKRERVRFNVYVYTYSLEDFLSVLEHYVRRVIVAFACDGERDFRNLAVGAARYFTRAVYGITVIFKHFGNVLTRFVVCVIQCFATDARTAVGGLFERRISPRL